jgi:hypothetical protein
MHHASLKDMPKPLQDAYLEANPDPEGLQVMFDRDVARMLAFQDISDAVIQRIRHQRWSSMVPPKWCVQSMRWHYHTRSDTPSWLSCRADTGTISERFARQISTARFRL